MDIKKIMTLPYEIKSKIAKYLKFKKIVKFRNEKFFTNNFIVWQFLLKDFVSTKKNLPVSALQSSALQKNKLYNLLKKNRLEIYQNVILNTKDCTKMKIFRNKIYLSSDDRTMTIFDIEGNRLRVMPVHDYGIWAFDCTKNYIVTGSIDRRVIILDKNLFIKRICSNVHNMTIRVLKIVNNRIIAGSRDSKISIYDFHGNVLFLLSGHTGSVRSLSISKNKKYFLSGSYDGTAIIWKIETGRLIKKLRSSTYRIYSTLFGQYIILGHNNGSISIYSGGGRFIKNIEVCNTIIISLKFFYDFDKNREKNLIIGSSDGKIVLFSLKHLKIIRYVKLHDPITSLQIILNRIILVSLKNSVCLFFNNLKQKQILIDGREKIYNASYNGKYISIAYKERRRTNLMIIKLQY